MVSFSFIELLIDTHNSVAAAAVVLLCCVWEDRRRNKARILVLGQVNRIATHRRRRLYLCGQGR